MWLGMHFATLWLFCIVIRVLDGLEMAFHCVRGHFVLLYLVALAGRSQTGVCTVNGEIVTVGGRDAWNCTNTVEIYDRVENKWAYLTPMSLPRRGAGVAFFKGNTLF